MAISHVGSIETGGTSVSSYVFDLSTLSCATGDLLLVSLVVEQSDYTYSFSLDNAGWTLINDNQIGTRTHRSKVWWNTVDGATITASSTITLTQGAPTSDEGLASCTVFRGVDLTTPFNTVYPREETAGVGLPISEALTGVSTDSWILFGGGNMRGADLPAPTDWTSLVNHRTGSSTSNICQGIVYRTGVTSCSQTTMGGTQPDYWQSWTVEMYMLVAGSDPTIAPNTADAASFTTDKPTLEFTGSDADDDDLEYQIQITDNPDSFTGGEVLADNYQPVSPTGIMHPNPVGGLTWEGAGHYQVDDRPGQSFVGHGGILSRVMIEYGGDTAADGYCRILIYEHQGTFGTSSEPLNAADAADTPTPDWIAESDWLYADSSTADGNKYFDFTGADAIRLEDGTYYVLSVDWMPATTDYDNTITLQADTALGHAGNMYIDGDSVNNGVWSANDLKFAVYEDFVLLDKLSSVPDAGFVNTVTGGDTHPFNAGEKISYTVQTGEELDAVTHYWHARAKDPGGNDVWSDYTTTRYFSVTLGGSTYEEAVSIARYQGVSGGNALDIDASASIGRSQGVSEGNALVIDASASIGRYQGVSEGGQSVMESAASLGRATGLESAAVISLDLSALISKVLTISQDYIVSFEDTLILAHWLGVSTDTILAAEEQLSLARLLGADTAANLSADMALTLEKLASIISAGILTVEGTVNLGQLLTITLLGGLDLSDEIILGRAAGSTFVSTISKEEAITLARAIGLVPGGQLDAENAVIISKALAVSAATQTVIEATVELGRGQVVTLSGTLTLEQVLSLIAALAVTSESASVGDFRATLVIADAAVNSALLGDAAVYGVTAQDASANTISASDHLLHSLETADTTLNDVVINDD